MEDLQKEMRHKTIRHFYLGGVIGILAAFSSTDDDDDDDPSDDDD
jgi:hypothetical protein